MGWTDTESVSRASFIADDSSIVRDNGRQIDWDSVGAGFLNAATGKKEIPAGTIVVDDGAGGLVYPRVDQAVAETAVGILEDFAVEDEKTAALSGYGMIVGGAIFQNLLADAEDADFATMISELEVAGVSTGWYWKTYADSRAS